MTLFIKPRQAQGGLGSDLFTVAIEQAAQHGQLPRAVQPTLLMIELGSVDPAHTPWQTSEALTVAITSEIRLCLRTTDNVYPGGTDKIAILLTDTTIREAVCLAERVRRQLEQFSESHAAGSLLAAIGLAQIRHHETGQRWIQRATAMCEQARLMGRSWVTFDAIVEQAPQMNKDAVSSVQKMSVARHWSMVNA